jgi:hypothetical protein
VEKSTPPQPGNRRDHDWVTEELPDDPTLIMEVLFGIRKDTRYIIDLLEEDDGEEEAEDA